MPLRKRAIAAGVALAILAATAAGLDRRARHVVTRLADRVASSPVFNPGQLRVVVDLVPPAYLESPPERLVNPERVDAINGTTLRLTLTGPAHAARFGNLPLQLRRDGPSATADVRLDGSGYLAIEPAGASSGTSSTLIPVVVRDDALPSVRIDAPGRDLLLPDATSTLSVRAAADDDHGLDDLELKYTKVSGSGEQFEFEEGTLPLSLSRETSRSWRGRANVALGSLKMQPGDALVYRAVARDRRPGAAQASSDTFYIEIQGPGQVALDSVALPPEQERYALSQQMVVLKIERLRAREGAMPHGAVAEESANIAAEQRAVRANFIFLMGGHVEDEEEEAEQSHEIQEGRLENSARRDITTAIRHMTRAEQGLTAFNTGAALPPARAAVEALQRAFGRNRYILRTMPVRSRIDPSRRLTGEFGSGSDWKRVVPPASLEREARESRALLAELLAIASSLRVGRTVDAQRLAVASERALAIDPASAQWQDASARVRAAAEALRQERPIREVAARLAQAMASVAVVAQQGALLAPPRGSATPSRLESAWAERRE